MYLTYEVRVKEVDLEPLNLEHKNIQQSTSYGCVRIQCSLIRKRFIVEVPLGEFIN